MKIRKLNIRTLWIANWILLGVAGFLVGANINKFSSLSNPLGAGVPEISAANLKKSLAQKDFVFINVHTPYEGEIEKADMFIEFDSMITSKDSLPKDKNAAIILYCKTGRMSAEALKTLKSLGYTNVRHLSGGMDAWERAGYKKLDLSKLTEDVLPKEGFSLPVSWGDIGPKLVGFGVIDLAKFEKAVTLTDEQKKILTQNSSDQIKIDAGNGQFVVDMLWALGLAQKSLVYDEGPLGKEYKKDVANFASTGGWTLAKGNAVSYLNRFDLIPLTKEQQSQVAEIAKNVYRPCCGNSTWFPDCNHGMAALAAIELLVSKGIPEADIYKYILGLNSFWFPDSYLTAATYFARQGVAWQDVDAKRVLGQEFSSAQGAADIAKKVGPLPYAGSAGGSCGT
ncbi:MAG: rhodanese-like domain-containing protein [bacterium]|nr:rhodanese-like domain-containing protein [bacterium]